MTEADVKSAVADAVNTANFNSHEARCDRDKGEFRDAINKLTESHERMHGENAKAREEDRIATDARFKSLEESVNKINRTIAWAFGAGAALAAVLKFAFPH